MPINTGSLGEHENVLFIDFGFGDILMTKGRNADSLYENQLLFSKDKIRGIGEESSDHAGLSSDNLPNVKMVMRFANAESITALIHSLVELQKEVFMFNSKQKDKVIATQGTMPEEPNAGIQNYPH